MISFFYIQHFNNVFLQENNLVDLGKKEKKKEGIRFFYNTSCCDLITLPDKTNVFDTC